MAVLKMDDSK